MRVSERASHVPAGAGALAPFPYIQFCLANAADCQTSKGPAVVEWSPANRTLIQTVNLSVNRGIRPVKDAVDIWRADVAQGDCNDYALTKRRALLERACRPGPCAWRLPRRPRASGTPFWWSPPAPAIWCSTTASGR